MKTKYIILCISVGLFITSCSNNEEMNAGSGTPMKVSAGVISNPTQSRVTYDGANTNWEVGDAIGVTGDNKTNICYKATTADAWADFTATGSGISLTPSTASRTYSAYYPFGGTEGTENNTATAISADNTIDYMYATTTTANECVSFTFNHQLAKLTVVVTDGTKEISDATWQIKDGLHAGSIIPSTGVVTTNAATASMSGYKGTGTYLLLPAQTVNAGTLNVTSGGTYYSADLSRQSLTLKAGQHTTLTLTVSGGMLTVASSTTTSWAATTIDYSGEQYIGCDYSGHEWVQLEKGGLKWATMNVGAKTTTDYGDYYAWGATYKYVYDSSSSTYTSKNVWSEANPSGYYNGNKTLTATNDIATIRWGDPWRMPTADEFKKLTNEDSDATDNYSYTWQNNGGYIKCTTSNSTGKTLFFPATGIMLSGSPFEKELAGYYWSSTPVDDSNAYVTAIKTSAKVGNLSTKQGIAVRPVLK